VELAASACQDGGVSTEDNAPPETIATLRIDLIDSDPPIWREVEVPTAITLKQLHAVVQAAMEWEDAHLWEFTLGREPIGGSRAARLALQDLLRPRVTRLLYTYDMGDCWEHQLTLTKPRPADLALTYPRYITGENPAARRLRRHPRLLCPTRSAGRSQPPRSPRRQGVVRRLRSQPL
jgi:hypothetical protein